MPNLLPGTAAKPDPDVMSFLLLVAVLVLLACTIYLIYLGCNLFGADVFFRAIYAPQQVPDVAARIIGF